MKGMTLVKKSTCAFAVLILFFVSFGIYAVYSGTKISQSANIIKEWSDNFGTVSQLSDSLNGMRLKASMLFITEDPAKQAQLLSELKEAQADVEKSINAAEDWGNTHEFSNPEGKEKVLASVKEDARALQSRKTSGGRRQLRERRAPCILENAGHRRPV